MASESVQMRMQKHLRNIDSELFQLRKLVEGFADQDIEVLRKGLLKEGFDKALVALVGSVPGRERDYKQDIRRAISRGNL